MDTPRSRKELISAGLIAILAIVSLPARTDASPTTGWVQAGNAPSDGRRLAWTGDGTLVAGSLSGLHASVGGGVWAEVSAAPDCLLYWIDCAYESVVPDPVQPDAIYATTYRYVRHPHTWYGIEPRGVERVVNLASSNEALTQTLLEGVRGNALAVSAAISDAPNRLVVGRIQQDPHSVGLDSNPFCEAVEREDACAPSVYLSNDDGVTWAPRYFEPAPCPNGMGDIVTSSRLVGSIAFDPSRPDVIYASANSGLWVSTDGGDSWTNRLVRCGSAGAIAFSGDKVYLGTPSGALLAADAEADGPSGFQVVAQVPGAIQSILPDSRDPSGRTVFLATWAAVSGTNRGGVFRVSDLGDGESHVFDLTDPATIPGLDANNRQALYLAQSPIDPDLLFASRVRGPIHVRRHW